MKNEVRPIDANALAKRIREYMDNFPHAGTRLATCRVVLSMLGDEGQTPTLTDHFPGLTKMIPLTMEQLRKMDGWPIWIQDLKKPESSAWRLIYWSHGKYPVFISKSMDGHLLEEYGQTWIAYAYPPAHIDRDALEKKD